MRLTASLGRRRPNAVPTLVVGMFGRELGPKMVVAEQRMLHVSHVASVRRAPGAMVEVSAAMDAKARGFIERLFTAYRDNPRLLPPRFLARVQEQGIERVVCDYIAGMTDRFCQDEYRRLFEPFERV